VAELVDGGYGVTVGVTGLHMGVVEGWANDGFRRRDALPGIGCAFVAIDGVAGQIGFADGQPAEVDGESNGGIGGSGNGSQTGGRGGREGVDGFDANGRRERTGELDDFAVDLDLVDALGAVLVDGAEADGLVEDAILGG